MLLKQRSLPLKKPVLRSAGFLQKRAFSANFQFRAFTVSTGKFKVSVPKSPIKLSNQTYSTRLAPKTHTLSFFSNEISPNRTINIKANARVCKQKRMAMSLLNAGKRKAWLDPEHLQEIQKANTREDIRKMIADGWIKRKWNKNEQDPAFYDKIYGRRPKAPNPTFGVKKPKKTPFQKRAEREQENMNKLRKRPFGKVLLEGIIQNQLFLFPSFSDLLFDKISFQKLDERTPIFKVPNYVRYAKTLPWLVDLKPRGLFVEVWHENYKRTEEDRLKDRLY